MASEVIEADREAAAMLIEWHNRATTDWVTWGGNDLRFFATGMPEGIRKGIWDGHDVVQAFARHRIAALDALAANVSEAMVEAAMATPGMKAVDGMIHMQAARGYPLPMSAFPDNIPPLVQAFRAMLTAAKETGNG